MTFQQNYQHNDRDSGDSGRRKRSRSRERDRDRSHSHSRDRRSGRDRHYQNNYERDGRGGGRSGGSWDRNSSGSNSSNHYQRDREQFSNSFQPRNLGEPSTSIIIKGLPSHTVEATLYSILAPYYVKEIRLITQRDGECKGYAFVEFISLEYAQYFITAFAGSTGDPKAPQLIIENRAVQLEFARDLGEKRKDFQSKAGNALATKTDWLCEACGCHNFARRDTCFRCLLARTENCISVAQNGEPFGDSMISCDTPSCFLVVRGFASFVTEVQLTELFRQFAVVKSAVIIRDPQNRNSRGFAYIEFQSVEHASYALQGSAELKLNNMDLKVAFARETVMHQLLTQMQNLQNMNFAPTGRGPVNPGMQSALVAQALQAAQWSINNGYAVAGAMPGGIPAVPSTAAAPLPNTTATTTGAAPPKLPTFFWPPNFDTHGGSYVFQPKTGYFLEPNSHFYYCPKSKLYYNSLEGTYYHYDGSIDPPFRKYELPLPTEEAPSSSELTQTTSTAAAAAGTTPAASTATKSIVSITLNKAKVKATLAPASKKVLKDLAKWGAIQKEEAEADEDEDKEVEEEEAHVNQNNSVFVKRSEKPVPATPSTAAATTTTAQTTTATSSSSSAAIVVTTTTASTNATSGGAPVCLLCRRQFPSLEMLARHEKESKLHAENLAKQKQPSQPPPPQYRDRAEERREKYGSVPDHIPKHPAITTSSDLPAATVTTSATAISSIAASLLLPPAPPIKPAVAVSEDLSNPGNQMLRKMGWKEGQGLGKDGEGKEVALGVELAATQNSGNSMQTTLKTTLGTASTTTGSGSNYREQIKGAARARYEELMKHEKL